MNTSYKGRCFIAQREACVTVAYEDGAHYSLGFGDNDPMLTAASTTTLEAAWERLKENLIQREAAVNTLLKIQPDQQQFDALVSCYFQAGNQVRPVIALVNAGLNDDAMMALLAINRDSTHREFKLGLAKRRLAEATMFMLGDYGTLDTLKLFTGDPKTTPFTEVPFPSETS